MKYLYLTTTFIIITATAAFAQTVVPSNDNSNHGTEVRTTAGHPIEAIDNHGEEVKKVAATNAKDKPVKVGSDESKNNGDKKEANDKTARQDGGDKKGGTAKHAGSAKHAGCPRHAGGPQHGGGIHGVGH